MTISQDELDAIKSFSFTAPNGVTYEDIVKVTRHYWEDKYGIREYFADAAVPYDPTGPINTNLGAFVLSLWGGGAQINWVEYSGLYVGGRTFPSGSSIMASDTVVEHDQFVFDDAALAGADANLPQTLVDDHSFIFEGHSAQPAQSYLTASTSSVQEIDSWSNQSIADYYTSELANSALNII